MTHANLATSGFGGGRAPVSLNTRCFDVYFIKIQVSLAKQLLVVEDKKICSTCFFFNLFADIGVGERLLLQTTCSSFSIDVLTVQMPVVL